jgi:hypothetical protein
MNPRTRPGRARRHEATGSVVLSNSGDCLPCASARFTSPVGDPGLDIECRGVVLWLSLRECSPSANGKLVQLAPESRAPEGPFVAGVTPVAAASNGKELSTCFGCASSMMDKTLRSFDSALRGLAPGGDDDVRTGRRGGEDDRGFVGLLRSELDADGGASAHSDAASEKRMPLPCAQPVLIPVANTSLVPVCGVTAMGLGDAAGARMERGGRMLNI